MWSLLFFVSLSPPNYCNFSVNNLCNISMSRYFLIGYMGSGKTTYGKLMAKELNLTFIDLDVYIESEERKTIDQIFKEIGEEGFRLLEKKALRAVSEIENVILATGGGTPCFFDNMEFMNSKGQTIYLRTSVRELRDRLKMSKSKRPLISGKDLRELEDFIAENLEKREPFYLKAKYILDTDDLNPNNLKSSFSELLEP